MKTRVNQLNFIFIPKLDRRYIIKSRTDNTECHQCGLRICNWKLFNVTDIGFCIFEKGMLNNFEFVLGFIDLPQMKGSADECCSWRNVWPTLDKPQHPQSLGAPPLPANTSHTWSRNKKYNHNVLFKEADSIYNPVAMVSTLTHLSILYSIGQHDDLVNAFLPRHSPEVCYCISLGTFVKSKDLYYSIPYTKYNSIS